MTDKPDTKVTPDQAAAHEFLTELRTRITTQPLPYQYGVEARALESLWEVFGHAREAMKKHPGCAKFADAVTRTLNIDIRPVTAKWHRAHTEGRLNSRDGADDFRADLANVQDKLRRFAAVLHEMAYGEAGGDLLTPPAMSASEVETLLKPLRFGIVGDDRLIKDELAGKINDTEQKAVEARRTKQGVGTKSDEDAVGLALSGGGIRSATFCLGVVQVLAARGLFKDVDFLSSVSGGGYTGSFLTRRLGKSQPQSDVGHPHGPDPKAIRYLRQHAKYLAAIDLKQRWSMVTSTLAGLVLNWTAPLLVIIVAALIGITYRTLPARIPWPLLVSISGALTVIALPVYGGLLRLGRKEALISGSVLGGLVGLTVLLVAACLIDAGYDVFSTAMPSWPSSAMLASLVAAGPIILRIMPVARRPAVRKAVLKVLLLLAGLIIPIGALGLFYALWSTGAQSPEARTIVIGVGVAVGLVAIFLLNINLTGFHRLYRDHLGRTFVQFTEKDDDPVPLAGVNPDGTAPYHLINTTVNLPSSTHEALRERRSDFFLFSKGWCGSPSTGYDQTTEWKTNNKSPDLATAMAISGAAASSHMGLGSMPTLRALLTFLNVRLGFWILRPGKKTWPKVPGFLCLLREMTGIGMSENDKWLNLSDGGHIENMGAYELLRRRCKYIICVDGESDPECSFHGLMTLVRHAQIDFGVRMEPLLGDMRPNATTGFSQTHATLFRVRYADPNDPPALFLYLKLSVTGNEPELIRRYRTLHPDFPHQTTLDQFFDEEQFEAYRQLGVHVAEGLFAPALLGPGVDVKTVPQWFKRLAINLLDPVST